jgi:PHD/YefM family antitoxin component YafN of YafNO toxin-antitoxin module
MQRSIEMNTIASSEIKRRGIGAVDELLENGPVHIIRNNTPDYVILTEESYKLIIDDLISARLDASDMDIKEGRVKSGTIDDLMREIDSV